MKILIYGVGPLGSLIAVRLQQAGHDVSVLARGQRLKELREYGVVLEDASSGERETAHLGVVENLGPEDEYDLIMVVMRKNQAVQILQVLAANRRVPVVLFMMNNAGGQELLIQALGKERVMIGFPYPGGERDGHVMRVLSVNEQKRWTLPVGEVDGRITERTRRVAEVLREMPGYDVQIRTDMDAWLKYHVAVVGGLAAGMYAANTDIERFGRTRDAMVLGVRAMKEALRSLRQAGVSPSPKGINIIEWLPEPLLVWILSKASTSTLLKVGAEGHARAARDEMEYLMDEFLAFVKKAGAETPVMDQLRPYFNPETPPIPEGRHEIPLSWRSLWAAGLVSLSLVGVSAYLRSRKWGRA